MGRLIDADALVDEIKSCHCADCDRRKGTKNGEKVFCYQIGDAPCRACGIGDAIEYLEDAPTVDAVPVVHGRWVKMTGMMPPEYHGHYQCSECGWHMKGLRNSWTREEEMSYCPNCGAMMDGRENDG